MSNWSDPGGGGGSSVAIGTIANFPITAGDSYLTSDNWLKCDGSAVSQSTYATLYSRVGLLKTLGTSWTSVNRLTTTNIAAVASDGNGDLYAMVGTGGLAYSTTDFVTVTARTSGTSSNLAAITYGGAIFCAVGAGGAVVTSTDAVTYNLRTSGTSSNFSAITYGNGIFVAGGQAGIIYTSTDGITWSSRTSFTSSVITAAGYGNGLYILGGNGGAIGKSTDGITWEDCTNLKFISPCVGNIQYFNSKYVIPAGAGEIMTSTDGTTFTPSFLNSGNAGTLINSAVASSTLFLFTNNGFVFTTTDLVSFSTVDYRAQVLAGACADSTRIAAVGNTGVIMHSNNTLYSYNTGTHFIVPNLNNNNTIETIGQLSQGLTAYYIKAL